MSCGINKSPDLRVLSLMSLKHPLLLITNPVVVLNKSKLLVLVSLVALWSLVGFLVVEISMGRDRSLDIWLNSSRNEGCSSIIVTNYLDLSILIGVSHISTLHLSVGLSDNHGFCHCP